MMDDGDFFNGNRKNPPPITRPWNGNAGQRNPQGAARRFAPIYAADLLASSELEKTLREGQPTGMDVLGGDIADATVIRPLRVVNAQWVQSIANPGPQNAVVLVPKNLDRLALKIANPNNAGNIKWGYNAPFNFNGIGLGLPLVAQGTPYVEDGSTISTDAIYVWSDDNLAAFPLAAIAFEAVLLGV